MTDRSRTPVDQERPTLEPMIEKLGHMVARCQWWQRRTGRQCRKAAANGRPYCPTHRGCTTLIGPANPAWRHGRWSRLLPQSLRASGPSILNHRDSIEVADGRIEAVLREITAGGAAADADLRATYDGLTAAMHSGDSDGIRAALTTMRDLLDGAVAQRKLFRDLDGLMTRRAALVDAERKFALDARNAMNREEAAAHANALIAAVTRHVTDRLTLNRILSDLRQLIEPPAAS